MKRRVSMIQKTVVRLRRKFTRHRVLCVFASLSLIAVILSFFVFAEKEAPPTHSSEIQPIAAEQCMDSILREKLFSAMDIDAAFAAGDIAETDMLVTLYRENGEVGRSVETQKAIHLSDVPGEKGAYFAGGFTISANDLAKLVALLASDGSYCGMRLLSSASVETMESCFTTPLPDGSYQALPLFYTADLYGREGVFYHSGSAFGVYNCVSYDSETGDGVVVLTTGANGSADHYDIYNICDEINDYIYRLIA